MKLEEVKFYNKINLEGDWIAYPEDVSVFVKDLLPYLKQLETKVESMEKEIISLQNRLQQLDRLI